MIERVFQTGAVAQRPAVQPVGLKNRVGLNQDVAKAEDNGEGKERSRIWKGVFLAALRWTGYLRNTRLKPSRAKIGQLGLGRELRIVDLDQDEEAEEGGQDAEESGLEPGHVNWARFRFFLKYFTAPG